MGNLENILENRLKQLGIKKQVDAAMVVQEAQNRIKEVFGENGNDSLRVVSYNKGVLKIAAKSSAWAAECQSNILKIQKSPIERVIFAHKTSLED